MVVAAHDKKRARLNCIDHLLSQFAYADVAKAPVHLPERVRHDDYIGHPVPDAMYVPARF